MALKQIRVFENDRGNGIPITALREISILKSLRHANVINVLDVAVGSEALDDIYMVMEYAEQVRGFPWFYFAPEGGEKGREWEEGNVDAPWLDVVGGIGSGEFVGSRKSPV